MTRMSYRYKVCLKCQHYPCKKEKECIEVNLKTMQIYFNNFDRKTEPQYDAEEVAKDINRRVDMVKKEWNARHIEDEPQTERSE